MTKGQCSKYEKALMNQFKKTKQANKKSKIHTSEYQ